MEAAVGGAQAVKKIAVENERALMDGYVQFGDGPKIQVKNIRFERSVPEWLKQIVDL